MTLDKLKVRALSAKCRESNPSFGVYLEAIDLATNTNMNALGDYERSLTPITYLAGNPSANPEVLDAIAKVAANSSVLVPLVQNPSTRSETIEFFFSRDDFVFYPRSSALSEVRIGAGVNPNASAKIIELCWKEFLASPVSHVDKEISSHTAIPTNFLGNYISYILGNPNTPQAIRSEAIEKYLPEVYEHQVHRIIIADDIIDYLRAQNEKTLPSRFISHPDIPVDMLEDFLADRSMEYQHKYILRNPSLPMNTFVSYLRNKQIKDLYETAAGYELSAEKLDALWELYKNRTLVYSGVMSKEDTYFWDSYILNKNSSLEVVDEITRLAVTKKQPDTLSRFLARGKANQFSYEAALDYPELAGLDISKILMSKHINVATLLPYIELDKHKMKSYASKSNEFLNRVKDYLISEGTLTEDGRSLPNSWVISILGW